MPITQTRLSPAVIAGLASWDVGPTVSLQLPLGVDGALRLDAAVRAALVTVDRTAGASAPAVRASLERVVPTAEELSTWSSVALYANAAHGLAIELPGEVSAATYLGEVPSLLPLAALLAEPDRFHVLLLNQHHVALLRGDRYGLTPVDVPGLPHSIEDALWYEDHERMTNTHGGSHQGAGRVVATVHGGPSMADIHKGELDRFCTHVDWALRPALAGDTSPLVVASVAHLAARFRNVTQLHHVLAEPITVSTGAGPLSLPELATRARAVMARAHEPRWQPVADRIADRLGTGKATLEEEELTTAAGDGRIDTLLVAWPSWRGSDQPAWVQRVAREVLCHRGTVVTAPEELLPSAVAAAALLRH